MQNLDMFKKVSIDEATEAAKAGQFIWWRPDGDINKETEHALVFVEQEGREL